MGSKLQRNAVIRGYINSYCLVCECYFDTDEEARDHVEISSHEDKLTAYPYLEKYGENHIRKVNKGYFCEFCNLLLATAAKVTLHVQEKSHFERKATFSLRRPSGTSVVIAFDDLLIDEWAWHSLSEDTCAICNEELSNENIHKTESSHLLKLVQTKVEFGADNNVYRKTDDSSFQCLTCNSVFALNSLNDHFTDLEHKKLYSKCQDEYKKYLQQNKSMSAEKTIINVKEAKEIKNNDTKNDDKDKKDDVKNKKDDVKDKKDDVKDKKDDVKDKNINTKKDDVKDKNINTKKDDVKVMKDEVKEDKKEDKTLDKNHNIKETDTKTENIEKNVRDCGCNQIVRKTSEPTDESTVFANNNNLTYNAGNTNAYCRICETKLPATLRSMKEHVYGKEHKNRLGKANQTTTTNSKQRITKKPMGKFIDYCVNVSNIFHEDVVINEKYLVPSYSFVMVTKLGSRYRCQTCEVTMYEEDIGEHTDTPRHEHAMQTTCVVTSLPDTEFVREVRPNVFHCGFCNQIIPKWDDVHNHLQSREHRDNKDECSWRLSRQLPAIVEQRRRQHMEAFRMMFMGHMMRVHARFVCDRCYRGLYNVADKRSKEYYLKRRSPTTCSDECSCVRYITCKKSCSNT